MQAPESASPDIVSEIKFESILMASSSLKPFSEILLDIEFFDAGEQRNLSLKDRRNGEP
jgi:hypothetical protein